jgi:hypothetical protein
MGGPTFSAQIVDRELAVRTDAGAWDLDASARYRTVDELTRALDLNVGFDPLGSRHAQELLDELA